ncbi:hypothetical protein L1987_58828 [Smallanthus sonchifolius]|uniref:Uncharacterized protein n=1 Tax=Smallanthus sonchifolius TaxID=185202 RepID=A0ACB9D447_9ASTR|nr:hypothetical protein L1987_58828 [Smallanthus sonchifolius]
MEKPSGSVNFVKSGIRVSFPPFNFLQLVLIFTLSITKSTSIPYSKYCNGVVEEYQSTETRFPVENFLRLDKAVYSLGFENPQFNFNPVSSQIASFSTLKAYETKSKVIVKVNAVLNLVGPDIIDYFSGDVHRRGLRLVKVRPPRFEPRRNVGAEFRLSGFWNSNSGNICMVGSGSVSSLHSVNVVFKFNYPNSSVLDTSLINGTLESITPEGTATYFKPISILGVSRMEYNFTYISKEIENGGFSVYDGMESVSLTLNGRGICSIITWGLRFELDYDNYDCKDVSCSFGAVGNEILPRFMSIKVVDCLEDGKVRYILQFSNSTYGKGLSFYPLTALVAEGEWDEKKKRVALVACQLFDKKGLRGCSIRLAFCFPSTLSLKHRSSIVGKMWSTETKSLGNVSFYSPANVNSRIKGTSYEYSEYEKVQDLCRENLDSKGRKGTYPDEKSPNLRFDMMVRNKKGQMAYGYASPLYIRDTFYSPFENQWNHSSTSGYINVSYVISFTTRGEFDFGGKIPRSKMVEISAEGVYNTKNGVICMIGCKHMPYEKFQKKRSLDCELAININFSPLNSKDEGMIRGNIKSTREKPDPLYFEPIDFGSSSITKIQARELIWRMDVEITMVLISNTLACIFIGLQLFHVKKNPDMLPFISVVMLVVLTLAHMIPLLLNFEAIFMVNRKQNVFLGTDQWLEVNEVLVRVITMIAFLLQFRLLQLTWSSRKGHESQKTLWVSDKKVLYMSSPLYIAVGLIAWFAHSLKNTHTKTRFQLASENVTFWGALKSYTGLVLDTFLIPQIMFNILCDSHWTVLAPSFYIGSTMVRLLPHVYDLYRTHSSTWFYDKIFANPGMDYYSTMWDVVICCVGMLCVLMIYVQQRFSGRSVLPKRFRDEILYQKVPVVIQEQQIF